MTPATTASPARARSALLAGVPAVAGSLAILLSASPASAVETTRESDQHAPRAFAPRVSTPVTPVLVRTTTASTPSTYTVRRGDTVSAIAARFGLRTTDVLALNGLKWSSVIYPGQVLRLTAGAAPSSPAAPPASAPSSATYVIRAGDTISAIAQRHGVSTNAVLSANNLVRSSIIYPGQKLAIPGKSAAAAPSAPAAPAAPPASTSSSATYVIRAGDTISAIAQRHGVSTNAVLSANNLVRSSIIYPGQKLAIPGKSAAASTATSASSALDAEQIGNAQLIIRIGRDLGVSDRGIAIALGTAMQESWLRNLDWGDRDSLGLFQQRPSSGWGTPAEVRDPVRAARAFYGGASDPNGHRTRGLLDIPGWQKMTFAQAAQAVQVSAHPDRYARWEQPAYAWLAAHG